MRVTRYETRHYTTTDADDALRLAGIDNTPSDAIRATHDVELVHVAPDWAYWGDGRVTRGDVLRGRDADAPRGMSVAAELLFSTVLGSDSVLPSSLSWEKLAQIETVSETDVGGQGTRGVYAAERHKRLECTLRDGSTLTLALSTVGYMEGYEYALALWDDRRALFGRGSKQSVQRNADGSCAECEPRPERTAQLWQPCETCGHEPIYIDVESQLRRYGVIP